MKITEKKGNKQDDMSKAYMEMLTDLRKDAPKKPVSTIQCASTQAILARDPSKDKEHWNRQLDLTKAYAVPNAKSMDEAVGQRSVTPEEISHQISIRQRPKNHEGQSTWTPTETVRDKAIAAYLEIPGIELTQEQKIFWVRFESANPHIMTQSHEEVKAAFSKFMEQAKLAEKLPVKG